jgi:transcriptional regulator with XRE-family HTH domain
VATRLQRSPNADWEQFILAHGWRASGHELAAVVGQPVEEVERVRRTGACTRLPKSKGFAELFSRWHGRAPTDEEWPIPRKMGARDTYAWQGREMAFLATLVGQLGNDEIAIILTNRLRKLTGDRRAKRNRVAVQVRVNKIGMQSSDVVGGITTTQAGREVGSFAVVYQAIQKKQLRPFRVGCRLVIPHAVWEAWKAKRVFPPEGYVLMSSIRELLSIRSDKLSEFARMGYIPTAKRCNPYGTKGPSTQFGTWWIDRKVAKKLVADRRAGRFMPWHGKPNPDNLRVTFKLWQKRKHPASCKTCAMIWGKKGAPRNFDDYVLRYPSLAFGAKRHLTRPWTPGLTLPEVATYAHRSLNHVLRSIKNGTLETSGEGRRRYVTRTDATRWRARRCPTGDGEQSWVSISTARKRYLFALSELRDFIAKKKLKSNTGTFGAARGIVYVSRHQCRRLREKLGFTERQAARLAGVSVARMRTLLRGVNWRKATGIPLWTVQAAIKRLKSRQGYTLSEAARAIGMPVQWVHARKLDGTIKVLRAKWDRRRVYITEPMLRRLKQAKRKPVKRERLSAEWLRLSDAAYEAGVSISTVIHWAEQGEMERRRARGRWRYRRGAVRSRARRYWRTVRFHRATPPDWLRTAR